MEYLFFSGVPFSTLLTLVLCRCFLLVVFALKSLIFATEIQNATSPIKNA